MKISCPHCGSENIRRLPGAAANGGKFIKAGVFVFLLAIVLPIGIGPMMAMAIGGLFLAGIGCLIWLFCIGRGVVSSKTVKTVDWWECQACQKEFSTDPLD